MRAADARPCANSALTQENSESGPMRNRASATEETSSPRPMSPRAASRPPTRATTARKAPVSMVTTPLCQASARAARSVAVSESWLMRR